MNKEVKDVSQPRDADSAQSNEARKLSSQMERMVGSYDSYMRKVTLGREHKLREMTVHLAQVKAGDHVLEVGCGTGTLSLEAKQQVGSTGKVFGIDIIPEMIDLSQQKAAKAKLDVTFQVGSIEDIPFSADQFDVVICSFMIFHMSEMVRQKGIEEMYRVLKPQGQLLVFDLALPVSSVSRIVARTFLGFILKHDVKELLPLMEASGFLQIEMSPANYRILGLPLLSFVRGRKP